MRFDPAQYNKFHVMHCPDEESSNIFTEFLEKMGMTWCSGTKYSSQKVYKSYTTDTCYCFNQGKYGNLQYYSEHDYIILSFYDFDWDELEPDVPRMSFEEAFFGASPQAQSSL